MSQTISHRALVLLAAAALSVIGSPALHAASSNFKDVCAEGPPRCAYATVQEAIDSIGETSASNVYTVFIDSGILLTDTSITTHGKGYITFVGRGIGASVIRASAQWFQDNQIAEVDLLDLSNSTNITIRGLTIDARTGDPCPSCVGLNTAYGAVRTDFANRILVEGSEILGLAYGIWEVDNTSGNLIQIFNSKILAKNFGISTRRATWHIFSTDVRAVANGNTSGKEAAAYAVNVGNSSSVENVTIWGSHLHGESGEPGKTYDVAAVRVASSAGTQMAIVGSTLHVKMTTASIGSATRLMSGLLLAGSCVSDTPLTRISVVGSDFLYESPTSMTQGRLSGLGWLTSNRCVSVALGGSNFIDNGGSGGTRGDVVGQPLPGLNYEPTINTYGSRLTSILNTSGTPFTKTIGGLFKTSNTQSGTVAFPPSNPPPPAMPQPPTDTLTVTLPTAMPDTNYRIVLTPNVNATMWFSAKTATSFTLKTPSALNDATVDWILMR